MPRVDTAAGVGHLCPVCGRSVPVFGRGPGGRANASCPHCGSLERHRLVAFVVRGAAPLLGGASALQIGPAGAITPVLTGPTPHLVVHKVERWSRDARPELHNSDPDQSAGRLPFDDDSFDLAVCTQVFDSPEAEGLAGELARVLRPGGVAVIYDGTDVSATLGAAGLSVSRLRVADLAGPEVAGVLGLAPGDAVAFARAAVGGSVAGDSGPGDSRSGDSASVEPGPGDSGPGDSATGEQGPVDVGTGRQVLGEWLGAALVATEQARAAAATENEILQSRLAALEASLVRRAERAERAASAAQGRYDSLRGRLPLRVATAVLDRAAAVRRARPLR